jgi:ankyrin repeat protein
MITSRILAFFSVGTALVVSCNSNNDVYSIKAAAENGNLALISNAVTGPTQANLRLPGRHSHEFATLLHMAASIGDPELADLLLHRGAIVDSKDSRGRTPLMNAVVSTNHSNRSKIAAMLIAAGAKQESRDNDGWDVLHHAVAIGDVQMVEISLKNGANARSTDRRGFTPMHLAMNKETARLLIQYGADPSAKSPSGVSVADSARQRRVADVLDVITNAP